MKGLRLCALSLALPLFVVRPAAAETWFESYHKAEEALANENWSEAIRHLNSALKEKPDSSARIRTYGMRFISYFPYLNLGIAYQRLGQTDAALQAFETEERQGEIERSQKDYALLQEYRDSIRRAKAETEAEKVRLAQRVVSENLQKARELEEQGRFDDALASVARALAVAPDQPEARTLRGRLLAAVAAEERAREIDARFRRLLDQGRADLASGQYRRAATSLRQAWELREDAEAQSLLRQAQERILAESETRQDDERRQSLVAQSLERASALEAAGERMGALDELQTVLALDPENREARIRQERILRLQAAFDEADRDTASVRELLIEAERLLGAGDFEEALKRANRALALEPTDAAALSAITRGYAGLSDALLATENAPPVILLDDLREEAGAGGRVQRVRSPEFILTGTVYDNTRVEISILDGDQVVGNTTVQRRQFLGVWISDFNSLQSLPAGTTTLDVVVKDEGGKTATERYAVQYAVPFVRSLWFPAAIAAALAVALLGSMGLRSRRRRQMLRRRFNPYIAGAPILEQKRFFGRQQLLDYVLRRIHNNSILIYGERRIGKTSFQHRLKKCLAALDDPDCKFFPVFIDLQGTPQEKFFSTMAAEMFQELRPQLDGLEPVAPLTEDSYEYRHFVQDVQHVLKTLKGVTEKRIKLVLLIDEVDELNDYDPRVNQKLRSLFMRTFADSLVSVVSGVAIKKHWEREGSPWYNFFQEIEVKPFDQDEAAALIETPVAGVFTFADGVVDEILRRTDRKPYLIQKICSQLVERLHEGERRSFTLTDVDTVCRAEGL